MSNNDWLKDYPDQPDPVSIENATNNSLSMMLKLVAPNSQVLEFGCASGYFSQLLVRKGCNVTGVEINAVAAEKARKYCREVIVADLDFSPLSSILAGKSFDFITYGDVLEHLRDPWRVLRESHALLKPNGKLVISMPNIAHGAIRIALMQGQFRYQKLGILDDTHIRFFTHETVNELLKESGFFIEKMERTKLPIFSKSNLLPAIKKDMATGIMQWLMRNDPESDTLQYIIQARAL